jgi:biotin carboxyl carrier protein
MRKETLLAPLSGIVHEIMKYPDNKINENDTVLTIECMKLIYPLEAGLSGKLSLNISIGEFVAEGQELGTIYES